MRTDHTLLRRVVGWALILSPTLAFLAAASFFIPWFVLVGSLMFMVAAIVVIYLFGKLVSLGLRLVFD